MERTTLDLWVGAFVVAGIAALVMLVGLIPFWLWVSYIINPPF